MTPVAADSDGVAIPSMMKPMTEKMTIMKGRVRTIAKTFSPAETSALSPVKFAGARLASMPIRTKTYTRKMPPMNKPGIA